MAQSGYTPILIYASGTATNVPLAANLTSSISGAELALNYADGKLFYKDGSGAVQVLATKGAGTIGGSTTQVQYNLSGALAGSANLTFNGTTLTANTLNLTNALGTSYGGTNLTSFTANGIVYASSTSALATGSALKFDGTDLILSGASALRGSYGAGGINTNFAAGDGALFSNTTGSNNIANGSQALYSNTTGSYNTANGSYALYSNTTGSYNTASGLYALYINTTGSENTASGSYALYINTTGSGNIANGSQALFSNTTGNYNIANGYNALTANTTGSNNIANGSQALYSNTTGSNNTASGSMALYINTTGSGNTAINPRSSTNSYAPVFDPTTQNNRFCMGSTAVTNAYIQVAWTVVSDARDKTDFAPVPHGLDFVSKLKTTAYRYKMKRDDTEGHGPVRYGFKSQDVLALEGNTPVIVDAEDLDKLRFNDQSLIAVLVNALQELNTKFDAYVLSHP